MSTYSAPIYLDPNPNLRTIAQRLFNYTGNKFKVKADERVECRSAWDGGSRDYFAIVDLNGNSVEVVPQNGTPFDTIETPVYLLTPSLMIVEHTIFCGKDMGITFHVHSSALPKFLPSGNEEVTRNEIIVLVATRSLKSSYAGDNEYRKHEAMRDTGITSEEWDVAKSDCKAKGLLNNAGAITTKGKNAAGMKQLYQLRGE